MSTHQRDLVPLRIPSGWTVVFNNFREIETPAELDDADRDRYLSQDLLSVERVRQRLWLDVGWHPDGDPSGRYRFAVIRESETVAEIEHADVTVIQDALDEAMAFIDRDLDLDTLQAVLDAFAV
jgi:hypothetical protein